MMMKMIAVAALAAIGSSSATSVDANDVDGVIRNLDLTRFPNSIGPGRSPHKATFADYGFVVVAKTAMGAKLVRRADGGSKSFVVISNGPKYMRLCFHDRFVVWLGGTEARAYNTTAALVVRKSRPGNWAAEQLKGGFPTCHNYPAAA
jgi:hypothetical protein